MSKRRNKSRTSKQNKDTKGWFILGSCFLLVIFFGIFVYSYKMSNHSRDKVTQCRNDSFISKETAIIFDATDSFSDTQAILIKDKMNEIISESLLDERFTFYILGKEESKYKKEFAVCNPGDGTDKNNLTSNIRRIKKQWELKFHNKISSTVDKLIGENTAINSPIMKMIKFASVDTISPSKSTDKRLIIVSDMIEHTIRYSHYKNDLSYKNISSTPYIKQLKSHLQKTSVQIMYILREKDTSIQNRKHILFWENFISASGGQITKVESIN